MSDKIITNLTEVSIPSLSDLCYLVDVSDTTDSASGSSRKLTLMRLMGLLGNVCQGRLTLSAGNPAYDPLPATPSSTDASADTCTFSSAHGWTTGTMVTPASTGGGVTAGTTYYINAVSTTVVSFHTTLANAEAGSSKVDLTGSVSSQINPFGVQSTTVRFSPYNGNLMSLYSGSTWLPYSFTELSLALGSVTSGLPYDVFVYSNSGTLTLEKVAWSSATARATDLTTQDGVYVKSGDVTKRYLGTIYTVSTSATEDSYGGVVTQVGGKRFVWNMYNRLRRPVIVCDLTGSWTYNSSTYRAANGSNGNRVEVISGLNNLNIFLKVVGCYTLTAANTDSQIAIGEDSTNAASPFSMGRYGVYIAQLNTVSMQASSYLNKTIPLGYHYYQWLEMSSAATTFTIYGYQDDFAKSGLCGVWEC